MKKLSKLKLNKKTISSLNDVEMSMVKGGTNYCQTLYQTCSQATCTVLNTCPQSCNTCGSDPGPGPGPSDYEASCNTCSGDTGGDTDSFGSIAEVWCCAQ